MRLSGNLGVQETVARAHQKLDIVYEDDNILSDQQTCGNAFQPADDIGTITGRISDGIFLKAERLWKVFTYLPPICLQSSGP